MPTKPKKTKTKLKPKAAAIKPAASRTAPAASKTAPAKIKAPPKIAPPDNKGAYLKFVEEVLNGGNFSVAATYLAADVKTHNGFPDQQPGLDGFVAALKAFHGAFPDLHTKVTHTVADGDMVVGRFEVTGTHRGTFLGLPGSGRKVHYEEIAMVRMVDGKVVEHWSVADALAIMQQLQTSEIA